MFRGRVLGEGDPAWTDLDRSYALAWQLEQASRCSGCGEPRTESMDKAHQFAYAAEVVRCHSCAAKERAGDGYARQDGADTAGLLVQLTHTPHGAV